MSQQRQEERHAHQRIATVVQGGINHTAIALTAYHGTSAAHLGGHVHLANGSGGIFASVGHGHIAQCTRRRQVAHRGARSVVKHIVGNGNQRVFLHKELAILHHDGQAVHVGVYDKAHIGLALAHKVADGGEVLGNGLGSVPEIAARVAEQALHFLHA